MIKIIITERDAGQRLDKYLHKYLAKSTSGFLYKMLRKKNITLNGKKASGNEMLHGRDEVTLFLADETILKFGGIVPKNGIYDGEGEDLLPGNPGVKSRQEKRYQQYQKAYEAYGKLEIAFENEHILIVNKPAGMLAQKAGQEDLSLNEWLIGYLLETGQTGKKELHTFKPSVCNRLDRNTSGLVLCGKTLAGSQKISALLKDRSLRKYYCLYVKGQITEGAQMEGYLKKNKAANRVELCQNATEEDAVYIKTVYRPLKIYRNMTMLEAELVTGKTHQIRIHLASLGHPVLGDYKYGYLEFNDRYKKKYGIETQLLHACRLEFPPMEGEWAEMSGLVVNAKPPEIFRILDEQEASASEPAHQKNIPKTLRRNFKKGGISNGNLEFQGIKGLYARRLDQPDK